MKAFLLTKPTGNTPQSVAHLYEHWFIQSFYRYVEEQAGINGGVVGYIGGETYQNVTFIEAWFYDDHLAQLFEKFVLHEKLYENLFEICLHQCEAEDRELWSIPDTKRLHSQFLQLQTTPWQHIETVDPYEYSDVTPPETIDPIRIKKRASLYRTITISPYLENASLEDRAVFQRLFVILIDIVEQLIRCRGWYGLDNHVPRDKDTYIFYSQSVVLPKRQITTTQLEHDIENLFKTFDLRANMPYIQAHFDFFGKEKLWVGRIRDQLHDTNVITSNGHIASLASPDRIEHIMHHLQVRVESVPYDFAKKLVY